MFKIYLMLLFHIFGLLFNSVSGQFANLCSSVPCFNGATCIQSGNTVFCQCAAGYSGQFCQTGANTNACSSSPCLNSGTCVTSGSSYYCLCTASYTGNQCQTAVFSNACLSNPCLNSGTCVSSGNIFSCICSSSYTGNQCQTAVITNSCLSNPCLNGATCVTSGSSYYCSCANNYYGSQCQYMNSNPCSTNPCGSNGVCTVNYAVLPYSYTCSCLNNYSGANCQTSPSSTTCVDSNTANCQYYSANNFCSTIYSVNGVTVPALCPKSCNTCNSTPASTCSDVYTSCSAWVASNYCNLYPVYLLCNKSCKLC